jgi:DMSO/TMAO reductase YedYZ molybdopterin-dependent catalytic subunit
LQDQALDAAIASDEEANSRRPERLSALARPSAAHTNTPIDETNSVFRSKALKKVAEAGYDPDRLPPGQYLTDKWPVLHAGSIPTYEPDLGGWDFRVFGLVEHDVALTYDELQALPQTRSTTDIHCVTRWSRFDAGFGGVHWRDLAELVRPHATARFVVAHAEQGFTANVPLAALEDDDALIAWEADGEPLTPEHGWPLRLIVPSKYFWKSAKWLRGLELRSTDEPGFWERYGYHNDADYWNEERYGF